MDSMEISRRSDTTIQPSGTSPSIISGRPRSTSIDENHAVITSQKRQETTRTAFCNYLASDLEAFEDRDFQTFGNEAVKRGRSEERSYQS